MIERIEQPVAADRTAQCIRLSDGRWLSFADYGDPDGVPLFAFHGTPGSRLMVQVAADPAQRHGVRLIAPDRPGLGRSSRQAGRRLAGWPDDVHALADALGIDRFGVVGVSGGGPHALACAWKIPERLSVCGTVSGVAPMAGADLPGLDRQHHAALELARAAPWLVGTVMVCGRFTWRRFPEQMYRRLQALGPRADQTVLARPEVAASLIAGLCEAFRQGSEGAADELGLFIRPWDFPLEAITMPVQIWHGARDGLVPIAAAHRLVDLIPDARLQIVPDGGHYVIYDLIDRLLATLRHDLSRAPHGTSRS